MTLLCVLKQSELEVVQQLLSAVYLDGYIVTLDALGGYTPPQEIAAQLSSSLPIR